MGGEGRWCSDPGGGKVTHEKQDKDTWCNADHPSTLNARSRRHTRRDSRLRCGRPRAGHGPEGPMGKPRGPYEVQHPNPYPFAEPRRARTGLTLKRYPTPGPRKKFTSGRNGKTYEESNKTPAEKKSSMTHRGEGMRCHKVLPAQRKGTTEGSQKQKGKKVQANTGPPKGRDKTRVIGTKTACGTSSDKDGRPFLTPKEQKEPF